MSECLSRRMRHWFTFYGAPGYRSPFCQRGCGTPNPRPLTEDDWRAVEQWRGLVGRLDAQTEAVLAARQQERVATEQAMTRRALRQYGPALAELKEYDE